MKLIKQLNEELLLEEAIDKAFEEDLNSGVMDNLINEALEDYKSGNVIE